MPATLYRRFEDKNALLAALYARYDLARWGEALCEEEQLRQHTSVDERVTHVVREHVGFYRDNQPILRTPYLYRQHQRTRPVPHDESSTATRAER